MTEPVLFGVPVSTVFLYFIFYSFAGWVMETVYCSIKEKRFVARGFLLGPVCPIYGVGVLAMFFLFSHQNHHLLYFYIAATIVMSVWEYFVGWLLEKTTHIKYWDYSNQKFNLNGRISLVICLLWGILAYIAVFQVHPQVENIFQMIPAWLRYTLTGSFGTLLLVDTVTTIRKLALMTKWMIKLEEVSGELRLQLSLGRAELESRLESRSPELLERLDEARSNASRNIEQLRDRRGELIAQAERHSRRFRSRYSRLIPSKRFAGDFLEVKAAGERRKGKLRKTEEKREETHRTEK